MSWKYGFAWAVPFAVWFMLIVAATVLVPFGAVQWRNSRTNWTPAIEQSRAEGDVAMATQQEAWLERDQQQSAALVAAGVVLALLSGVAPFAYRRLVPAHARGGWRAAVLALVVFLALGAVGAALLVAAMAGAIRG